MSFLDRLTALFRKPDPPSETIDKVLRLPSRSWSPAANSTRVQFSAAADAARTDSCIPHNEQAPLGFQTIADQFGYLRDRDIEMLSRFAFLQKIVNMIVDDALLGARPQIINPNAEGNEWDVWPYLEQRGFLATLARAYVFSNKFGGGAVLIEVEDGLDFHEPVDLNRVSDIRGFTALSREELIPQDMFRATGPRSRWHDYGLIPAPSGYQLQDGSSRSGLNIHPSRIIPIVYRHDIGHRERRRVPEWFGWGPGMIEAVLGNFLEWQASLARTHDLIGNISTDYLEIDSMADLLEAPDGWQKLINYLRYLQASRNQSGNGIPIVAHGPEVSKVTTVDRRIAGVSDAVSALRDAVADGQRYPRYKLFGQTAGGLGNGDVGGEQATYRQWISSERTAKINPAIVHVVTIATAAKRGPTNGELVRNVEIHWPKPEPEPDARAATRKTNAEAREIDRRSLGLSPDDMIKFDQTVAEDYPGLQKGVEEGSITVSDGDGPDPSAPRHDEAPVDDQVVVVSNDDRGVLVRRTAFGMELPTMAGADLDASGLVIGDDLGIWRGHRVVRVAGDIEGAERVPWDTLIAEVPQAMRVKEDLDGGLEQPDDLITEKEGRKLLGLGPSSMRLRMAAESGDIRDWGRLGKHLFSRRELLRLPTKTG